METDGWVRMALAASLVRDEAKDSGWLVAQLAGVLGRLLPGDACRIQSQGLIHRRVVGIEIALGDYIYRLHHADPRIEASRTHSVRGIALKTEPMGVDAWLAEVGDALERLAADNAATARTIREVLGA